MTHHDPRGMALSSAGTAAGEAYEAALQDYLHYRGDPLAAVGVALAHDPAMPMARVLKAYLLLLATEARAMPAAREAVREAETLAADAQPGERHHIAAARLWAAGQPENAARLLETHLLHHPRDLLALSIGHYLRFFLGQVEEQRDIVARAMPAWDEDVPGFGLVLGLHAFGLNETGQYGEAEEAGRRAVACDAGDNYAIHAVAHVMESQARVAEGLDWLARHQGVWTRDNFAVHTGWHRTLLELEAGDTAAALANYDAILRRVDSDFAVDLNDATALLWRLHLAGIDCGGRWQPIAEHWSAMADGQTWVFNDMHGAMAFAAAGRHEELAALQSNLGEGLRRESDNARIIRRVGAEVIAALDAFGHERYAEAARRLFAVRARGHELGCSRLQQSVLAATLIEAALRAGDGDMALAVTAERSALDPRRASLLELQGRAAALRGDARGAEDARHRADALRAAYRTGKAA
jgi:hypothetical protein